LHNIIDNSYSAGIICLIMEESGGVEKKKKTINVLFCNECAEPLEFKGGGKGFCPTCGIAPAVNDIFIKRFCPECNIQTNESASCDEHICPNCNQVYAA
jgi:hypothetical protein